MWKKFVTVTIAAISIIGFGACGSSNNSSSVGELDQIKENGEIVFGTEGTYAPFSYHDADDKLTGYDVEVATAVAKELGVKAKFVEANWDSLLAGVDAKKFDTVADQVRTPPKPKPATGTRPPRKMAPISCPSMISPKPLMPSHLVVQR